MTEMKKKGLTRMKTMMAGLVMAALLTAVSAGYAAEPQGLQVEITPYAWLAGLEGDITVNGQEADFEKSASDLLDAVDVGGSLLGVVQYDRFLFWGQVDYFSLSTDELDEQDQPQGGSLDSKMLLGEAAVGYQIDGWSEGQTFDILVGARVLSMENDLVVFDKGTRSKDSDLTDPMLVVRPSLPVFPSKIDGLRFNPTLGIGGGGDSDLVYELFPQFQYQCTDSIAVRLGYRTVGYKFKGDNNEENELNVRLAGLIAGVGFTF
jgi:opacity protein-like surface antigen